MQILVLGRHPAMLQNALARLTQQGYVATGYTADAETVQALQSSIIDLVVIGGGVEDESRRAIKAAANARSPLTKVIDVYGPQQLLAVVQAAVAHTHQPGSA